MNRDMEIIKAVALAADGYDHRARDLGKQSAKIFRDHRAQITGLANVVNSAVKVSDVLDFVKKQIGKTDCWRENKIGEELLNMFDQELRAKIDVLILTEPVKEPAERQRVHLMLMREFVKQLTANFEYYRAEPAARN